MKRILYILAICIFYAGFCHAGPFGLGIEDQISGFPKIKSGSYNGERCCILQRPIILKKVNGKFMLFFENDRLAKMIAVSDPVPDMSHAEKYFKLIYDYVSDFGGSSELPDGHNVTVSQVRRKSQFDVIWDDFEPDTFSSEENEICSMNLKINQNKDGLYVVLTKIIYRNAVACRRK